MHSFINMTVEEYTQLSEFKQQLMARNIAHAVQAHYSPSTECTHPTAFEDRCTSCGQYWN